MKYLKSIMIFAFLIFASPALATTYYGVNAGGNWNTAATWSTISAKDATRVGGAVVPTASDDCIPDDYSGLVVVNATTCVCKTLNCTDNTAGMTFTASQQLSVSGSVTFDNTMGANLTGTGTLRIAAAGTLTMDGLTFPGNINFSSTATITVTLPENLVIHNAGNTGTLTVQGGIIMSGAFNITCDIFTQNSSTFSFISEQTLTVTTGINIATLGFGSPTLKSATASSAAFLTYQGTAANCKIAGVTFTDVNASGSAQALDNWYGGTLTRTTNIINRTTADFATAAQAASILSGTTISGIAGTFNEATRNTDPGIANVKNGTNYKIQNSALQGTMSTSGGGGIGPW
jgi:cytoskeletal protein CcmA (bactofilin family)